MGAGLRSGRDRRRYPVIVAHWLSFRVDESNWLAGDELAGRGPSWKTKIHLVTFRAAAREMQRDRTLRGHRPRRSRRNKHTRVPDEKRPATQTDRRLAVVPHRNRRIALVPSAPSSLQFSPRTA